MQMNTQGAKAAPPTTPTDLKPGTVRDLADALNTLLADMLGLYLKTKNFHWHIRGRISATITCCWMSKAMRRIAPSLPPNLICDRDNRSACSVIAREGSDLRRRIFAQINQRLVHIAPAPSLGWIISLDDGMPCSPEMPGRMLAGRLVAAAHVTARSAYPQMKPGAAGSQAFLAPQRARNHRSDNIDMRAAHLGVFASIRNSGVNGRDQ
jgi:hypothetical protein